MRKAYVRHHVPGRLRLAVRGAQNDDAYLARVADSVRGMGDVDSVEVRPLTGSLVIHYEPSQARHIVHDVQHKTAAEDLLSLAFPEPEEEKKVVALAETEAQFLAEHSSVARRVVGWVRRVNRDVKRATANTVDLAALVPLAAAVLGTAHAGNKKTTPLWMTLFIFSFNSFIALHSDIASPDAQGARAPARHP